MKNFLKRVLALALVLVMVSGYVPANVFAAEAAPALPTATVDKIENDELTFAMNFKADDVTAAQKAYYGNWFADFELTVNKDVTFNANGGADGYLSGQYDAWSENWVNVPFENVTLNANEPLKIMAYAAASMGEPGLKYTYAEVYDAVKDFDCGIFFEPAFLAANPDLKVTLELKMYDPEDETVGHTIGETYVYTIPTLPTATVAEIENDNLTFAMNFKADDVTAAQKAYYGNWYADFELTINKDVTFNANGGADGYLSGQYDAWSENWVNVPFKNVTLNAGETLKIMAYAAESMGEPGLKYTYAEAYDAVKDFDCGVFFEPAFLAANPDLEVTLELKMYNPHDESINKVIGNTYTFKNEYVAYNVQTGKLYTKVSEATLDAVSGETVRLLKSTTDVLVNVLEGVTLDLDGYQLEANYIFSAGDVVDDSQGNTGVLKVPTAFVMLQLDNRQLPVNTAEGYKFYEILGFNAANMVPEKENATKYAFQPKFEAAAHEALLAGTATSNVTIGVRVTWPNDQGGGSQIFTYGDEMVKAVLNSYRPHDGGYDKMYTLLLNGTNAYPGLSCQGFVALNAGSTNVEFTAGAQRVTVENQLTTEQVNLTNNAGATAVVPQGTKVDADAKTLTLKVTDMTESNSNISLEENEAQKSVDVHIEGVAEDNTVPMLVTVEKLAAAGLNEGNLKLYHVENGATNLMTQVMTLAEVDEHNEFYYDPITGNVTMALATFSEVAVVSDTTAAWEGKFDYSWYTKRTATNEYTIANADQLAAFGAIVGGMNGQTKDSFEGKTVKLLADINLGDKNNANKSLIFHPVGYYYTDDKNADGTTGDYYSTVYSFEGTFDGNGHTVSNFYQNTWEIKGDYDGNYYDVAMGLFGYVVNGTVKNLTVDNFSSDGEFTPTGVIAAYAVDSTFENIAITNCNPRVYNTGNGGIVGIGGNSDDPDTYKLTFNNITIDNSNIISALWGSWDVACGGLVGMFRGAGHVYMNNCHVAAQMDVNNDVCGNYQYYWYRYSGMMVGTNKNMTTDANGYTVPETSKFHAENCTVHFGDWNDYYYCELVANSLASYTHDHQFSRLTQIQNISEIQDANGNWTKTGNFILMDGKTPTDTCYHIINKNGVLTQHQHKDAGEETVDVNGDGVKETVLKENNQRIYLPFNQLFTGYGWGVKHIPVYNGEDYAFKGITILDRKEATSEVKFAKADTAKDSYSTGTTVTIGELFKAAELDDEKLTIKGDKVQVTVSPVGEGSTAGGTYTANTTDWTQGTLAFSGVGAATITITDYYFCMPTVITVIVGEEKFVIIEKVDEQVKGQEIELGDLFEAAEGANITSSQVTVAVDGTPIDVTPVAGEDWTKSQVTITAPGEHKITITDQNNCVVAEQTVIVNEQKFEPKENVSAQTGSELTLGDIFTEADDIEFDIDSKEVEISVSVAETAKRNRTEFAGVTIQQDFDDWTKTKVTFTTANKDITFSITDNYFCVTAETTIQVGKADPEFEEPTGLTATYGDTLEKVTLPDGFAWKSETQSVGNAGDQTHIAVFTPTDTANYNTVEVPVTVTVAKADPTCEAPTGLTATYGQTLADVKLPNGFAWKDTTLSVGAAGENTFAAIYTPADTANYNTVEVTVTVTVAKADPTCEAPTGLTATYGQTLADVELPEGFTWKNASQSVGNAGNQTHTAVFTPADPANYNVVDVPVSVAVAKATPEYTTPTGLTANYGETLADVALPEGFTWKNQTQSVGEVGVNEFTTVYTPADPANYNTVEVPVTVTVKKVEKVQKFESKFTGDFLYRVGNQNTVKLDSLFAEVAEVTDKTVAVTFETITGASGTYTPNATWTNGTIQFSGTGVVKVTITDGDTCIPTELILEVVDAKNITTAESATSNNVVLLNNTTGGFSVSGRYGFYGNGFTITLDPNSHSTRKGNGYAGYIHMNGGTIDNVRIEGPVFAESNIYQTQALHNGNGADDPADYFRNGICIDSGDAVIVNSYVSGARVPVLVKAGGNVTIENSRVSGGAYANIEVIAATSLTLKNVTTEQAATKDSYGKNKDVIGLGIVLNNADTKLVLDGVTQYNWITQSQWSSMLGSYESSFPALFTNSKYENLRFTKNGTTVVNTGIIYACDVTDPIMEGEISGYVQMGVTAGGKQGIVYTMSSEGISNKELGESANAPEYKANTQNPVPPSVEFDYTSKNNEPEQNGSNEYCYYSTVSGKYLISFTEGDSKAWHYDILTLKKGTTDVTYSVAVSGGAVVDNTSKTITFSKAGDYTVTYTYEDARNYKLSNGEIETYSETYYEHIDITVFVVEPEANPSTFTFGSDGSKTVSAGGLTYVMPNVSATKVPTKSNNEVTASGIGSKTIDGETIYYPIIGMHKVGSSMSYYNYFSVFEAVTIEDANETDKYNINTTTMPGNLTVIGGFIDNGTESNNGTGIFNYSTGKTIRTKSVTVKGTNVGLCYYPDSSFSSSTTARAEQTIVVKYCYTDTNGKAYYYYIGYWCAQGKNGVVSSSSGGSTPCVTPDTLVTLADGSKKRIDTVTYEDQLLVWDFVKGEFATAPASILVNHGAGKYTVATLNFSDGTSVNTINGHGFYHEATNEFVILSENNAADYVGHSFLKQVGDGFTSVTLDSFTVEEMETESWGILTAMHYNCMLEDMFTMTDAEVPGTPDYLMPFEVGADMKYDEAKMQADIEKYGLYTYEDFADLCTYEQFVGFGLDIFKVSVAKGYITWEDIEFLLNLHG